MFRGQVWGAKQPADLGAGRGGGGAPRAGKRLFEADLPNARLSILLGAKRP